jgi:glycosyltransferase involved in cell wall biosynthesis
MVIISNGFSKFHLSVAAAEADRRNLLTSFVTGAYPTPQIRKILSFPWLRDQPRIRRLAARREQITEERVHALYSAEALYAFGMVCHSESINVDSFRFYGRLAVRHVEQAAARGARIYHFRSGLGGDSLRTAKRLGMFLLCDHASPHPYAEEYLVENLGRMPAAPISERVSAFYGPAMNDMEQADAILVNSQFAACTFKAIGYDRIPVHRIYLGIDDAFLAHVPEREKATDEFRLLFAGHFERRKGAEALMDAVERLGNIPWRMEIAGPISPDLAERSRSFFANPRVKYLGMLSRRDLATAMTRAEVFVFPSLSEGSARVVFEALACGCYVVTTPNSGSIVEDGVHGSVVGPGDGAALTKAIEVAYQHRDKVSEIGKRNAECVRAKYRQRDYGDKLSSLYRELVDCSLSNL